MTPRSRTTTGTSTSTSTSTSTKMNPTTETKNQTQEEERVCDNCGEELGEAWIERPETGATLCMDCADEEDEEDEEAETTCEACGYKGDSVVVHDWGCVALCEDCSRENGEPHCPRTSRSGTAEECEWCQAEWRRIDGTEEDE